MNKLVRHSMALIIMLAATVSLSGCGDGDTPTDPTPTTPAATDNTLPPSTPDDRSNEQRLLDSAKPLHAHVGGPDGTNVLCDADSATSQPDGHGGLLVEVHFRGPANLHAETLDLNGKGHDQLYTVGSQENGHTFDFPATKLDQLQTLTVHATSADGSGTCWLVDNLR